MPADEGEEPTQQWPSPAEEDTDPAGFAPIVYAPAVDPFVTDDDTGDAVDALFPPHVWGKPPEPPTPPRRSRRLMVAVLATVVALGAMTAVILVAARHGTTRMPAAAATSPSAAPGKGTAPVTGPVTGPVDGRTSAAFDLVDGAASVRISARDLGTDLYRISTPAGSGATPRVESDRNGVRLHLAGTGSPAPAQVEIVLTTTVRWTLRLDGGTQQTAVDLSGARVDSIDLGGGADRIDLTLPMPTGLVPVRLTGGVDQFRVRLADATPVRVRVQSGAGEVTLDGTTHRGIAPGRSFTAYGWGSVATGIDLSAVAGMSALTITAS